MREPATFLDLARLNALDAAYFRARAPYPWLNPEGLLTPAGYQTLHETLPPLELFTRHFGARRKHGQAPHDRYALDYHRKLPVDAAWHGFVAELEGPAYRDFLARMLGTPRFVLSYHWHYTPNGCSVSPHCDARRKLGSHIWYFNTVKDWDRAWGGETVILDDGGRFAPDSAPAFEDFPRAYAGEALGNRSLLFARRGDSWHGVRPIRCPPQALRKVFIVIIEQAGPLARLRRLARLRAAY